MLEGLGGFNFGRIWLHALVSEYCAVEGNFRWPDLTLSAVEDNAMLMDCLHQLQEVVSHAPWGYACRSIYHHEWQLCWVNGLLPGPFISERHLGASSAKTAYAGTYNYYDSC